MKGSVERYREAGKEGFIPPHSSWVNMVERWFGEITNKRIRRYGGG
jgi:transposase